MTLSELRLRSNLRCLMAREQYFVLFHDNQCKIKHYYRHLNIYPSQKQAIADASLRTKTVKKVIVPRCWFQKRRRGIPLTRITSIAGSMA